MRWIYICYLVLIPLLTVAQEGYINAYNLDRPGVMFSDLLLKDDTLVIYGMAIPDTPPYVQAMLFAKLDTNGRVLTKRIHREKSGKNYTINPHFPSAMIRAKDGSGYIALSQIFERGNGVIIKYNNLGNIQWEKEYPDPKSRVDFYREIVEVNDGFLILGHKLALDNTANVFVMKIDHQGNKIWEKNIWNTMN